MARKVRLNAPIQIGSWAATLIYPASFENERRLIHRAPWSSVKLTYLLCRYYPLLYWIVAVWAYCLNHKPRHCKAVLKPIHALLAPFVSPIPNVRLLAANVRCHLLDLAILRTR